jgi:large repetitive protein
MKISILAILPLVVLIFSAMMVSGLNPLVGDDWEDDIDGDGLIALDEFLSGSDPNDWDTDNDMLIDGVERGTGESTNGHVADTDNDGTG